MTQELLYNLNILYQLIKTDMLIFKKGIFGDIIDTQIWAFILVFVTSFLYPKLGMSNQYGVIYLLGTIVSCALVEAENNTMLFVSDMEGNNVTSYQLTLPKPKYIFFLKQILTSAIRTMILSILILPLGKLLLWNRFSFAMFSSYKFLLIFVVTALFAGSFSLLMASLVKNMAEIDTIIFRLFLPLWFLGGVSFPWYATQKISSTISYLFLINPVIFASEGVRAAVLGQQNYINFWICITVLTLWTFIFGFIASKRLQKRLDAV